MALWEERAARNEAMFRHVNEAALRVRDDGGGAPGDEAEFICECANADCLLRITVPLRVYEETRADSRRFLVAPGHEERELEDVVVVDDRFLVVEKRGRAAGVAERTDPRS